jgi:glutamyl-tRNA synthetase
MNPEGNVVTRFAPSPTGFLHGGNYRTAIFAYLFAKGRGGCFVVRIEDTDKARSKKEYEENILETLEWLHLEYDELYHQSNHLPRHREMLKKLIENNHAYVAEDGVVRFRNPNRTVTFTDAIRGEISVDTTDLNDFIIARSMESPLYHLAVVVDDADEGVSHVIRGEDHISNTPRQILIGEALGLPIPQFAHVPLVLSPERTKLSKRAGAKALTEYRDEGYLPEAVINYLALLGWHPEGKQEIFSVEELGKVFDLARIQKSAGIFDETKLAWINSEHIKRLSDQEFTSRFEAFSKKSTAPALIPLLKERAHTLKEADALREEYNFSNVSFDKALLLKGAKSDQEVVRKHLERVGEMLLSLGDFSAESVKNTVFPYATEEGRSAVLWPMRVALSGREKSPDPFTLSSLLGKEETLSRLKKAESMLK